MGKRSCKIRVGTSGWHYDHWRQRFYPSQLPKSKWFEYYAEHFDTVEINNTFYHLPKEVSVQRWYEQAPKDFVYTVKANRFITHIKRLDDVAEALERFFETVGALKEKLGPVLYQLPPSMHKDLDRLGRFLELLPKDNRAVFEFRHKSWFCEDTYRLLDEFDAAFCVHDLSGLASPRLVTGRLLYVRFHGSTGRYRGDYPTSALKDWAEWIKENTGKVKSIYAYFNNDYNAYAVKNAKTLRELLVS